MPDSIRSTWLNAALAAAVVAVGTFSVDGVLRRGTAAVATIQPRNGAPGYSWLRVYFYPAALGAKDRVAAVHGRVDAIKQPWSAVLQYTLDADHKIWQTDLSLPGHTCTVAASDVEAKSTLSEFQLDGGQLRLQSEGKHVCDMSSLKIANQTFAWSVHLTVPVVAATK